MNEASKNISELLSGTYSRTIVIGGKVYVMKAPAIKVIVRATKYLSLVNIPENATVQDILKEVSEQSEHIIKGLSYLIVGDVHDYEFQSQILVKALRSGTYEELCSAFLVAFELIAGRDFFGLCQLGTELAKVVTKL